LSETRRRGNVCIFTHIAAGAFVGALAPTPAYAPVFGLGSHIALDLLPHYDFERMWVEILFGGVVVAVLLVGGARGLAMWLGAVFAVLPDLENLLWKLGVISNDQKVFPGHVGMVPHGREAGILNLLGQFGVSAFIVIYLLWGYS
jgi:hypothetical protein